MKSRQVRQRSFRFRCWLRPAEARQLRWCDVKMLDGSLATRYEKVSGIVHITKPKTLKMEGHGAQQHCLWSVLKSVS